MKTTKTTTKTQVDKISKHVETLNGEMGELRDHQNAIRIDMAGVKTDISWMKRFFWIVATSSVGALVAGIFQIFI